MKVIRKKIKILIRTVTMKRKENAKKTHYAKMKLLLVTNNQKLKMLIIAITFEPLSLDFPTAAKLIF